jgi:hypothetical protein
MPGESLPPPDHDKSDENGDDPATTGELLRDNTDALEEYESGDPDDQSQN